MLSIAYSDFTADFREARASEGFLYIADSGWRPAKPNKANVAKAFFINNMTENSAKQIRLEYHTCYQLLTAILTAILREFGWMERVSLSGIRALIPVASSVASTPRRWLPNPLASSSIVNSSEIALHFGAAGAKIGLYQGWATSIHCFGRPFGRKGNLWIGVHSRRTLPEPPWARWGRARSGAYPPGPRP